MLGIASDSESPERRQVSQCNGSGRGLHQVTLEAGHHQQEATTTQHASLWLGKARPVAHTKITIAFLDRKNPPGFSSGHTQSPKANSQTPKKTRRRDDERGSAQLFFILKTRCLLHHASSFILHASPRHVLLPLSLPLLLLHSIIIFPLVTNHSSLITYYWSYGADPINPSTASLIQL